MVGLEMTLVFCSDCSALSTRVKSLAENTAFNERLVPSLLSRELRLLNALFTPSAIVLFVPLLFVVVVPLLSAPVVPVAAVDVTVPPEELTVLVLVEPLVWPFVVVVRAVL